MDRRQQLAATVVHGKDGWLFHRDDFVVEQVAGLRPFADAQVDAWRQLLEARRSWSSEHNAQYVFFVAPEKYVVYSDMVIDGFQVSEYRPARQIEQRLRQVGSDMAVVYPVEALVTERTKRDTYLATDTHWNMVGAYLGYRELCRAMESFGPVRILREEEMRFDVREFDGDLSIRLDPEPVSKGVFGTVQNPRARGVGGNGVFARGSVLVFEQPNPSLPRAVIFRDSFAHMLLPLLAETFSRLVAVSSMELYRDLVESERPDVVITEVAERLLNAPNLPSLEAVVPDDLAAPSFETVCKMSVKDVAASRG